MTEFGSQLAASDDAGDRIVGDSSSITDRLGRELDECMVSLVSLTVLVLERFESVDGGGADVGKFSLVTCEFQSREHLEMLLTSTGRIQLVRFVGNFAKKKTSGGLIFNIFR